MKTITLHIKDKGYRISIPGISEFNSPGIVDISKLKIEEVLIYLTKMGIDFEIKSSSKKIKPKFNIKKIEEQKEAKFGTIDMTAMNIKLEDLKKFMLNEFILLHNEILNVPKVGFKGLDISNLDLIGKDVSFDEDDEDEYIPRINVEALINTPVDLGYSSTKSGDFSDNVNKLKNIK